MTETDIIQRAKAAIKDNYPSPHLRLLTALFGEPKIALAERDIYYRQLFGKAPTGMVCGPAPMIETDIRAPLADVLDDHMLVEILRCICGGKDYVFADEWGQHVADSLLTLPDIAIVELPEPRPLYWPQTRAPHDLSADQLRAFAARLLAAAKEAEEHL